MIGIGECKVTWPSLSRMCACMPRRSLRWQVVKMSKDIESHVEDDNRCAVLSLFLKPVVDYFSNKTSCQTAAVSMPGQYQHGTRERRTAVPMQPKPLTVHIQIHHAMRHHLYNSPQHA
eukprot:2424111-Amphidinium_carterae.1